MCKLFEMEKTKMRSPFFFPTLSSVITVRKLGIGEVFSEKFVLSLSDM